MDPGSFDLNTTMALGSHSFDYHYNHGTGDLLATTTTEEAKTCTYGTTDLQTQICVQSYSAGP